MDSVRSRKSSALRWAAIAMLTSLAILCPAQGPVLTEAEAAAAAQTAAAKQFAVDAQQVQVLGTVFLPDHHALHTAEIKKDNDESLAFADAYVVTLRVPLKMECGAVRALVKRSGKAELLSRQFSGPGRETVPMSADECFAVEAEINAFFHAMYDLHAGPERMDAWLGDDSALRESIDGGSEEYTLEQRKRLLRDMLDMMAVANLFWLEGMEFPPDTDSDAVFDAGGAPTAADVDRVFAKSTAAWQALAKPAGLLDAKHLDIVRPVLEFYRRTIIDHHQATEEGLAGVSIYHVDVDVFSFFFRYEDGRLKLWTVFTTT